MESWEFGLRSAVLLAGARLLEGMLEGVGSGRTDKPIDCSCGARMESHGRKEKKIKTILGDVCFRRSHFLCPSCGESTFPGDEILDVVGTMFSPGTRRLMARAGHRDTFKEGRGDLFDYAQIQVHAKDVERVAEATGKAVEAWHQNERRIILDEEEKPEPVAPLPLLYISYDGTGVPMVPWETTGRKGKQPDGTSKTREVKLGCVFTQTTVDDRGRPVRDDESTTFVGAIENSQDFGWRIYAEAVRRGLEDAQKVVVIADGARYNWEIASMHFPQAIQIVDLYHAREHLHDLCVLLSSGGEESLTKLETRWRTFLDEDKLDRILREAKKRMPKNEQKRQDVEKQIGYFANNAARMRYRKFRAQCLFVGSGVIEAGCKTIIGMRLKQSGMQWTVRGANSIISLRCCHLSGRMEDYWEQRTA